jgi:hypothetical protein
MMESHAQLPLPGLGPELDDGFRFTWWNTREGAAVWIEHQGRWRAGVVVGLGRKRAAVAIEAARFKIQAPFSSDTLQSVTTTDRRRAVNRR